MKKTLLSVFLVFSFLVCLMPLGGALAAPYIDPKTIPQDGSAPVSLLPGSSVREAMNGVGADSVPVSDMIPEEGFDPDDAPLPEETVAEEEPAVVEEPATEEEPAVEEEPAAEEEPAVEEESAAAEEKLLPAEEDVPVVPEETPESAAAARELAEQIESDGLIVMPLAEEDTSAEARGDSPVSVSEGDVFFAQPDMMVYNNGGTVYANGSLVFNNAGTVYANSGTVYNNAGTIYANGGTVYNNAGTVFSNGASVFGFEDDGGSIVVSEARTLPTAEEEDVSGVIAELEEEFTPEDAEPADVLDRDDFFFAEDTAPEEDPFADEDIWFEDEFPDGDVTDRGDFFFDEYTEEEPAPIDESIWFEDGYDLDQDVPDGEGFFDWDPSGKNFWDDDLFYDDYDEYAYDYGPDAPAWEDYGPDGFGPDRIDGFSFPDIRTDDEDLFAGDVTGLDEIPVIPETVPEDAAEDTADEELPQEWLDAYAPVLETYRAFLENGEFTGIAMTDDGDYYLSVGETGVSYLCRDGDTPGYFFRDLDKDGVPELLVTSPDSVPYDGYLFDMFTLLDGEPFRVLASSDRIRYFLTDDDLILYEGSGGASNNIVGVYEFVDSRLELVIGIVMDDGDCYEIFGTTLSGLTEDGKDQVPITLDEYDLLQEMFEEDIAVLDTTPFLKAE